jgi:hypothetical protein
MTSMPDEVHAGESYDNRTITPLYDRDKERGDRERIETSDLAMPIGISVNKSPNG